MAPLRALGVRARRRPVTTLQNGTSGSAQSGSLHDKNAIARDSRGNRHRN